MSVLRRVECTCINYEKFENVKAPSPPLSHNISNVHFMNFNDFIDLNHLIKVLQILCTRQHRIKYV